MSNKDNYIYAIRYVGIRNTLIQRKEVNRMESEGMSEKARLYTKINRFRADVIQQDWSDDKMMTGKTSYRYLSTDKIKKQVAPLLVKHGLELELDFKNIFFYHEPVDPLRKQCTVELEVKIVDIDTGCSKMDHVYGEGGDFLDKAVSKAQTYALKEWLTAFLMLADGIDTEAAGIPFQPKTPVESESVRSKILENAVKPPAPKPVETPKVAVPKPVETPKPVAPKPVESPKKEIPVAETPKDEPKEDPKPIETPVGDDKSDVVTEEKVDEAPVSNRYKPTGMHKKAIDKIVEDWTEDAKNGKLSAEQYNEMTYELVTMTGAEDARAFIRKYKKSV